MATKLDAKELVTFRDAILTEAIQFEVLVNLSLFNNSVFTMKTGYLTYRLLFNTGVQYS